MEYLIAVIYCLIGGVIARKVLLKDRGDVEKKWTWLFIILTILWPFIVVVYPSMNWLNDGKPLFKKRK